jgi:5'-deoxynucleotidase YfbR-like HD superfamily hydrolase
MANRIGDWMEIYSARKFWVLDPQPEEILITDIAHALSQICRFNGHTKYFYSVGQHSLNCAEFLRQEGYDKKYQLYALLHDASEAYICDIPRPVKPLIQGYHVVEEKLQNAIYNKFGLEIPSDFDSQIIKFADDTILMLEATTLMNSVDNWIKTFKETPIKIECLDTSLTENLFIEAYNNLKLL